MKCPKCGFENQENVRFCSNCGLPRELETVNTQKTVKNPEPLNYNMPMNFHLFYSIVLLCAAVMGLLSTIVCLFLEDYVVVSFATFLPSALLLTTSILLLMKNKVGRVMQLILNIYLIVRNSLILIALFICGLIFGIVFISAIIAAEASEMIGVAVIVFIVIALWSIFAIGNIVINGLIISYYNKRKHMFR